MPPPLRNLSLSLLGLGLAYSLLLWAWARFSWGHDLYSFTLLIPLVCGYLLYQDKQPLPAAQRPWWLAVVLCGAGALALALGPGNPWLASAPKELWVPAGTAGFVLAVWAILAFWLGREEFLKRAFPLFFLAAMVPLPPAFENGLEVFLQHCSAEAAALLFGLSGMTLYRDGLVFNLPGISLEVAPECSGIHSSIVLFITSLVAGYLFLKSPWRRAALSLVVIPLAILRNGFRVWVLGEVCVHIDPALIHSPLHHRGGPLFFVLSLIPFSALLWWLWRKERKQTVSPKAP